MKMNYDYVRVSVAEKRFKNKGPGAKFYGTPNLWRIVILWLRIND